MTKLIDKMKLATNINKTLPEIPWKVWTTFWNDRPEPRIADYQISFTGDYKNIEEVRESLEWLVKQFDGDVKWK